MPSYRVELGFESTIILSDFLVLDDPVKGKLDAGNKLSGGSFFYDVTQYVQSITMNRGKDRLIGQYSAGQLSVSFDNTTRVFDPTYTPSPFYSEIVPKRKIRIWVGNVITFVGIVDDWNLNYSVSGDSTAEVSASDGFALLANRTIFSTSNLSELSGARVETILNDEGVSWPVAERSVDPGLLTMGADTIPDNSDALNYLQLVEQSEGGNLFIGKDGNLVFRQRYGLAVDSGIKFADDGTGLPYSDLVVSYGSEQLYNNIRLTSGITSTTATVFDQASQDAYGYLDLDLTGLLNADDAQLTGLANQLLNTYKKPEYRFEQLSVMVSNLTVEQQQALFDLELGDLVQVVFTPNGLGPAIDLFGQILGINHNINLDMHSVTFNLGTLPMVPLRLDSLLFGKLDVNSLG